jgi:hypothetical protein
MNPLCSDDKGNLDPLGQRTVALGVPQMLADDHLIENRFDTSMSSASVPHVFHPPRRQAEPLLVPDRPWEQGSGLHYPGVLFDPHLGRFRMYYTLHKADTGPQGYPVGRYFLAMAESEDGLQWDKPSLGLHSWGDEKQTNIVLAGRNEVHTAHVHTAGGEATNPGTVPERFLRGHRYVMYHGDFGSWLATSDDGVHWEQAQQVVANRIDCYQTISYDEERDELVSFVRNKLIFGSVRKFPEDVWGNTRAVSRLSGPDWWREWDRMPISVLLPEAGDGHRFYGMPTFRYGGLYWGFLHHLYERPQRMDVELAFSRDGLHWQRAPGGERLLPTGVAGRWDAGMILSSDRVVEVGDEWRLYYSGCDAYHDAPKLRSCVGLASLRKEGFVSVRAGEADSYLLTRPLQWPGGRLAINAAARGFVQVRVTDHRRRTIPGFGHDDGAVFRGDAIRHPVRWREADLASLAGETIRLEFKFGQADLFAFVAEEA